MDYQKDRELFASELRGSPSEINNRVWVCHLGMPFIFVNIILKM